MNATSKVLTVIIFLVMGTIGYLGLVKHSGQQASSDSVKLSCVEFQNQEDAEQFKKTGVIPAGSKISNKSASECTGLRIAAR
ncbi:MAG: hypothetical protein Q7K26_00510 [bacterium]|nr:hypothetical protein [bacterium]